MGSIACGLSARRGRASVPKSRPSRPIPWARRAGREVSLLALCAGRCDPPFGPPEAHEFLYLTVLPANVSYEFPPEAEVRAAMAEVAAYYLEVSYQVQVAEGVADPLAPGDLVGPVASAAILECGDEAQFVADALWLLGPTLDFRPYEHVVVLAPGLGCTLNGQAVGFLYVLGNHERILIRAANDGVGDDPATYLDDLELLLANTLGVTIAPGQGDRDNEKFDVTIPMERKY